MKVINLYGGPGCGKSTTAAAVFALLKQKGYRTELMREPFKAGIWDGYAAGMADQVWITGLVYHELMQYKRGGVDVVVSDVPLLMGTVYGTAEGPNFRAYVRQLDARFQRLDVFLRRVKPYESAGRLQDEMAARNLDFKILGTIQATPGELHHIDGDASAPAKIVDIFEGETK